MNLNIYKQNFIVCGAGSGLGRAITEKLLEEGAVVYALTRTISKLDELKKVFPEQLHLYPIDLVRIDEIKSFLDSVQTVPFSGALLNAGGPPAKAGMETTLEDWDTAYHHLVRWKIYFTQQLIKRMKALSYGRLLFIESAAVKQPVENLILSTSMRLAVTGFVKTLSQEIAAQHITMNVLAPGFHDTPAVKRVFDKKASAENITLEEAKASFLKNIPTHTLGTAGNFGSLGAFLLSPASAYITGQTISIDGGLTKFIFG